MKKKGRDSTGHILLFTNIFTTDKYNSREIVIDENEARLVLVSMTEILNEDG